MNDPLRYPIGTMQQALAQPIDYETARQEIAAFPSLLRERVEHLKPKELQRQYRENSWTIRQLVHHCADSHSHALLRIKRALTQPEAQIYGYNEGPTAELPDYNLPIESTLLQLDGLHARFAALLAGITAAQRQATYYHTGEQRTFTVEQAAQVYAWHGKHHLAHINLALAAT